MTLPYSGATTGDRALVEIQKILRGFGCSRYGSGTDWETGEVYVQFEFQGRQINLKASAKGYAAAWLKENPWTHRRRCTREEQQQKAMEIGEVAVYSILRDWVKGQITAIEVGIMTFDAAFLSYIMPPSGKSVIEEIQEKKMLPPPQESKS